MPSRLDTALVVLEVDDLGFTKLIAGLDGGPKVMREELKDGLADATSYVEAAAIDLVPKGKTGRLERSIGSKVSAFGASWLGGVGLRTGGAVYAAGYPDEALDTAPYGPAVELGAARHMIRPKGRARGGKRALWWEGLKHPIARANHPGQAGQHFLKRALEESTPAVKDFIRQAIVRALRRIEEGDI